MSADAPRVVVREPAGWSPSHARPSSSGGMRGTIRMGAAATDPKARGPIRGGQATAKIVTGLVMVTTGMAIFDLWLLGTNF